MMTPIEMQGHIFKSGRGYQKNDVDEFLDEVMNDYEQLYRENVELKDKISTLSDGLQYYKDLEKTLQKTLVVAEKAAEETKQAAQKNADALLAKAQVKAEALLSSIRSEAETTVNQIELLEKQYESYRIQCRQLAKSQLELLDSEAFQIKMNADFDLSVLDSTGGKIGTMQEEKTGSEEIQQPRFFTASKETAPAKENDKLNRSLFHWGAALAEETKDRALAKSSLDFLNEHRDKAAEEPNGLSFENEEAAEKNSGPIYDYDSLSKGEPEEERRRELLLKRERAVEIRNAEGLKRKQRMTDSSAEDAKNRLKLDTTSNSKLADDLADDLFDDDLFEFINPDEEE